MSVCKQAEVINEAKPRKAIQPLKEKCATPRPSCLNCFVEMKEVVDGVSKAMDVYLGQYVCEKKNSSILLKPGMRYHEAYVALLTKKEHLPGVLYLGTNLKKFDVKRQTVVLVAEPLFNKKLTETLELYYDRIISIASLTKEFFPTLEKKSVYTEDKYNALLVWALQYEKCIYLDSSIMLTENPDDIFNDDDGCPSKFEAVPKKYVCVVEPSDEVFIRKVEALLPESESSEEVAMDESSEILTILNEQAVEFGKKSKLYAFGKVCFPWNLKIDFKTGQICESYTMNEAVGQAAKEWLDNFFQLAFPSFMEDENISFTPQETGTLAEFTDCRFFDSV